MNQITGIFEATTRVSVHNQQRIHVRIVNETANFIAAKRLLDGGFDGNGQKTKLVQAQSAN